MTDVRPLARPRLWLGIGWTLVLTVVVLSLIPLALPKTRIDDIDKVEHLLAYLALMWWFAALVRPERRLPCALALCVLGGVVEVAQSFTGWRAGDWWDLAADGVGIALGWLLARLTGPAPFRWLEERAGWRSPA